MFKPKRPFKKTTLLLIVLLILIGSFIIFDQKVRPTVESIAEVKVNQVAIEAINSAVRNQLASENISYEDFIIWQKDNHGRIAFMQANTVKINQMQADMALKVQGSLKQIENEIILIPIGQAIGSYILAHMGPNINVKIMPIGTVNVRVDDVFEHAGINQTRHKIYLGFTTMVRIAIPLGSAEVEVATQVPVTESIIVGDVPNFVADLSGGIFGGGKW